MPVTYRYQVELGKEWRAYVRDDKFLVIAPAVKPSIPVAIDTSKMSMETKAGWARFDGRENLDKLLQDLTPVLSERAASNSLSNCSAIKRERPSASSPRSG